MEEVFQRWKEDAEKFKGDKALFWAGRMSHAASMVVNSFPCSLSSHVWLLNECRKQYDKIIFSR